jgi:hypothetical protein
MLPGDEETRAGLEQEVAAFDPSSYWSAQHLSLSAIAAANLAAKSPPPTNKPLYNPYEGEPSGRQLSESIPEFLSRLPPLTTPAGKIGPWIQIANPSSATRPLSQDLAAFTTVGTRILESLSSAIAAKEATLVGRPKTMLNRQLTQLRTAATKHLLDTAREHGVTTGKWMLFPMPEDVNAVWEHVAEATASGYLGSGAKVATDNGIGDGRPRLVCVYTEDFSSTEDVKRVLKKLATMGLVHKKEDPRGIYYKCGGSYLSPSFPQVLPIKRVRPKLDRVCQTFYFTHKLLHKHTSLSLSHTHTHTHTHIDLSIYQSINPPT